MSRIRTHFMNYRFIYLKMVFISVMIYVVYILSSLLGCSELFQQFVLKIGMKSVGSQLSRFGLNGSFLFLTCSWAILFMDAIDWLLSFMENLPLGVRGASSSAEPRVPDLNYPAPEEIENALHQRDLAEIKKKKDDLAEQIVPIIQSEKDRLLRTQYAGRDLGELPSPKEMVEILINRSTCESARNANRPNAPREDLPHLKTWLTRAKNSSQNIGGGNMSINNQIKNVIEEYFK